MEHAGLSVESGSRDQLDQGKPLDLDPNFELDADGFDFVLDGAYDQADQPFTGEISDDAAVPGDDPKPGDAGEEANPESAADEQRRIAEGAEDVGNSVEADVEYQDEIGYEDDDLTTEADSRLDTTEPGQSGARLSAAQSEGQPESAQLVEDGQIETSAHEEDSSWHEGVDFEEHGESFDSEHESGNAGEGEATRGIGTNNPIVDDFEDETVQDRHPTDYHSGDLDKELEDPARPPAEVPDIEVLYDEGCYSLFGTSEDNPDSYFLSEVEVLDRPLSQCLSALRAVISEDLAPTDELVIRFDPLELEFGERSNAKFLGRSFREILECHRMLSQVPDVSADAVIHLMVRRDIEEQFLDLLADAELVKNRHDVQEDSDMSDFAGNSRAKGPGDEQTQDEPPEGGSSDGRHDEDEGIASTASIHSYDAGHATEDKNEFELDIAPGDDDDIEGQEHSHQADASASRSPNPSAESVYGVEEGLEGVSAEANPNELAGDGADKEQVWGEQVVEGGATISQHTEGSPEMPDEQFLPPPERQDGNESAEIAVSHSADGTMTAGNDGLEEEVGLNDDDLVLTFDDDPGLSGVYEEGDEYDKYTATYDASVNAADGDGDTQEYHVTETGDGALGGNSPNGAHVAATAETASVHTSTTINGDEIGYDEQDVGNDSLTPANDGLPQSMSVAPPGAGNDEIDWENDEDEQRVASGDGGIEDEGPQDAALSPPSVAGKRSRTDEAESPTDETDHKRRRT